MEPDDLLCSRNARPQKALVERAQWKIKQPPSLKRERESLEGSIRRMRVARCAQWKAGSLHPQWVALIEEVDHNGQWKSMSAIREIKGRQIVDSQGNPTVEEE
jgi:hypothetical protein